MKQLTFKPLRNTTVILKNEKRGKLQNFIEDLALGRWLCYDFYIDEAEAKELFKEMVELVKVKVYPYHYSSEKGNWFIRVQAYAQPILKKTHDGRYLLNINTYRKA